MMKKRLVWAKKYAKWSKEDWRKVLFSSENHFCVQRILVQYIYFKVMKRFCQITFIRILNIRLKRCSRDVSYLWNRTPSISVEGIKNSDKYIDAQNSSVGFLYWINLLYINKKYHLVTFPKKKKKKRFFENSSIAVLGWSGNSLDIITITNLWSICKERLKKWGQKKSSFLLLQDWFYDKNIKDNCEKFVDSILIKVKAVIKAKTGYTYFVFNFLLIKVTFNEKKYTLQLICTNFSNYRISTSDLKLVIPFWNLLLHLFLIRRFVVIILK